MTEWNLKNKASGRVNWARPGQILLPYTAIFHGIFWIIPKSMKLLLSQNIKFSTARAWKTKPNTARLKPPALIIDLVICMSEDIAIRTYVCPIVSSMSTTCVHRYTPALLSSCPMSVMVIFSCSCRFILPLSVNMGSVGIRRRHALNALPRAATISRIPETDSLAWKAKLKKIDNIS